jgi:hypothetical protein
MKIQLEGYPVSITQLNSIDLKMLQDHYLPLILTGGEDEYKGAESRISKNASQRWGDADFFKKWNDAVLPAPYIQSYIDSFMFQFPYKVEIDTWYNVHNQYDHQQLHNHITTNVPAFSSVVVLKQSNPNSGQLVFRTPNLSNHLKYLELDPLDQYPNTYKPIMKEGVLIIFPSCLEHYVYYNQTNESRVVFASNIIIKRQGNLY